MHNALFIARQLVGAVACMAANLAFADCTLRATLPAETAFNARAMAALVAAMPPAPPGVVATDARPFDFKRPPGIYSVLCEGSKEGAFSITARRQYVRKHSDAERRYWSDAYDRLTAQFHALKKLPADKVAEQQALRQQSNAAWQTMRDAEKAGDKAAAQTSNARYRSLRDEADAMDAQHQSGVRAQMRELDRRRAAIDLEVQRVDVMLGMNLQRLPEADEGVLVGRHGAASPGQSAGLKAHNVVWTAAGSDGPLRQALVAALERARLPALLSAPLPGEAESEAAAAAASAQVAAVPDLAMAALAGTSAAAAVSPGSAKPGTAATATPVAPAAPAAPMAPATTATAVATANPAQPAAQAAAASAPPPATKDPLKKASDAVNRLRGLLGR